MSQEHPFHILLPEQGPNLRRRAMSLTGNSHSADDLIQETLLKAWAKRDSFTQGTNLRAWLFTIMRNNFYSNIRKRQREVEDINEVYAQALSEEPGQEHALELKQVISAVKLLPEIYRTPLLMMGAYGYSQRETSQACNCTLGTIKSRVSRGRTALIKMSTQVKLTPGVPMTVVPTATSSASMSSFLG